MSSLFFKDFEPSKRLWEIREKPFEHGQEFIREIFRHMQINDEEKISQAITHFKPNIYKKGDHFVTDGEICDKIGFIIKGGVEIYLQAQEKQQILFFLTEEDFFTDLKSFLHQKPSRLNIEFIETSIVLEVGHHDFKSFIAAHPEFGTVFMRVMSYVTAAVTNMNITLKLPGKSRYEKLLKLQPQLFNRFLLQDIASFLGVKQETLSRIRNQLKKETASK